MEPVDLNKLGNLWNSPVKVVLTIWVQCRMCQKWMRVPSSAWLTRPRPCCDECFLSEPPTTRVDSDGWLVQL